MENSGYNVEIFHSIGTEKNINLLLKKIEKSNPIFVGFSSFTGIGFLETIRASKAIKEKNPDVPIVWGGVHSTIVPKQTLKQDFVDIIVMGEGELTIQELADKLYHIIFW